MEATAADVSANFDLGAELDSALNTPTPEPDAAPATVEATPEPEPAEAPVEDEGPEPEPEPEAQPVEEKPAEPAEDLPEGVEVKDRGDGKKVYNVRETQFNKLITADRTIREIEGALGEPVTKELFESLYDAKLAEDRLYADFLSGDPAKSGTILDHFKRLADHAIQNGESSRNPFAQMVMQMPQYLQQSDPHGYEWQRNFYARDTVDRLYQQAAQSGNEDLLRAVQWVDRTITGNFRKAEQIAAQPAVDPLAQREAQIAQREQQILAAQEQKRTEQWNGFLDATNNAVLTARSEEIDAALSPIKEAYKDFPDTFEGFRERLNSLVRESLNKDERWKNTRDTFFRRSEAAPSEQVRQQLQAEYLNRLRAKLKGVLSPSSNPTVKRMLDEGATAVKTRADLNRQRLSAAAQRREPGGGGASKQNSVLPPRAPNGRFQPVDEIQNEIAALLG